MSLQGVFSLSLTSASRPSRSLALTSDRGGPHEISLLGAGGGSGIRKQLGRTADVQYLGFYQQTTPDYAYGMKLSLFVFLILVLVPSAAFAAASPLPLVAWLQAHQGVLMTLVGWPLATLVLNLVFGRMPPEKLVALFYKNRNLALVLSVMKRLGLDPAGLLHDLQHYAQSKLENPPPVVVSQLPSAMQAVIKDPVLIQALEGHASKMLADKAPSAA